MATQSKIEAILALKDTNMSSGIGKATKGLQGLQKEAETLKIKLSGLSAMKLAIGGLAAGGTAYYANEVRKIADEYTNLNSRLKLVTDGEQELALVRERLYQISQQTGTEYAGNADSYAKLARAVKDLGGTSEETLQITELVNKSLIVNGSSSEMASSFMLQFAQALGSGVLQGDEFRAMLESNSFFAGELAKALNTNIAGLRQMSKDGELTAGTLRTAFPKMAQAINSEFSKISPTVERAMTMLGNSFKRIIDESNRASGGTKTISQSIINLAQTIDQHREGIIALFTKMIDLASKTVGALGNIGQSFAGWDAVFDGKLSFFEFATMNAKELNAWLKENIKSMDETGKAAQKAGAEISQSAKQSADTQKEVTKDALKEMKKQYQDYAKEVKKLQGELADNQRSVQEELRDMQRSGMSDVDAWRDRKKEAAEFTQKAKEAGEAARKLVLSGNTEAGKETYKVAIDYADKAKAAYKGLNEEVKDGDRVVISGAQALQTAMAGVKAAGDLKSEFITQQIQALTLAQAKLDAQSGGKLNESLDQTKTKATELATAAETAKTKVQELFQIEPPEDGNWGKVWAAMESGSKQAGEAVTSEWDKVWDQFLASGSEDIAKLEKQLAELTKDRHVKVFVESVQQNRWGGLIGAYQTGGEVARYARGGKLPGYGGGDRVRALLEPGEFVIRKEAVSHYGVALMQALNSMRLDKINTIKARVGGLIAQATTTREQRFQQGGLAQAVDGSSKTINLNLTLPGSSKPIPMKIDQNHVRELERVIKNMYRNSSGIR
ncbi:MAG: tape measure protein [Desulfobulbus sp.]